MACQLEGTVLTCWCGVWIGEENGHRFTEFWGDHARTYVSCRTDAQRFG